MDLSNSIFVSLVVSDEALGGLGMLTQETTAPILMVLFYSCRYNLFEVAQRDVLVQDVGCFRECLLM